jgi:hypothetical protein
MGGLASSANMNAVSGRFGWGGRFFHRCRDLRRDRCRLGWVAWRGEIDEDPDKDPDKDSGVGGLPVVVGIVVGIAVGWGGLHGGESTRSFRLGVATRRADQLRVLRFISHNLRKTSRDGRQLELGAFIRVIRVIPDLRRDKS